MTKKRPNFGDYLILCLSGVLAFGYVQADSALPAALWALCAGARLGEPLYFRAEQKRHEAEGFF